MELRSVIIFCLPIVLFTYMAYQKYYIWQSGDELYLRVDSVSQTQSCPPSLGKCTHKLLREYYTENHHFPGAGKWTNDSGTMRFQPHICKLDYKMDLTRMTTCIRKLNMTSLMAFGDSNGNRYFKALVRFFRDTLNGTCKSLGQEKVINGGFTPDKEFFTHDIDPKLAEHVIVNASRGCRSCQGGLYTCTLPTGEQVYLKKSPMMAIHDTSLQVRDTNNKTAVETIQEFVLRFTPIDFYPDIIIFFCPFHHTKFKGIDKFSARLEHLRNVVKKFTPKTTKVFFVPGHGEFESARTDTKRRNMKFEGFLADQKIYGLTKLLYDELESDLLNDHKFNGFFNLWYLAASRVSWCEDGIHMEDIWYDNIIAMFMETLCNGNI